MDEIAALSVLTEDQKTALLKRIHEGIKGLEEKPFSKAARWTVNIFCFATLTHSVGAPPMGYGATFAAFAAYIVRKRKQLAEESLDQGAEEIVEDEL